MNTIHKYHIQYQDTVNLPETAKVIHFDFQDDTPTIWVEQDLNAPTVPMDFRILGTGYEVPPNAKHIKSVIHTPFVWHLYQFI